jgi:hypothetical protein
MGINRQQRGHAAGAKAALESVTNPPAGLFVGRVFAGGPNADQQVLRPQGLLHTLRGSSGFERQTELGPGCPSR